MTTSAQQTSSPRILIVEDNPTDRSVLISALRKYGYQFAVAKNGQEALDLYSQEFFPIIITDRLMPEMDGLELSRLIRSMNIKQYIYIILLSARDSKADLVEGLEAGADEYLSKPFHLGELQMRLKTACRILNLETFLKKSLAEVHELSIRDPLTGLFNRGYMNKQLKFEVKRTYRYTHSLSVIIGDIDHFKAINDIYGHLAGDEALVRCADIMLGSIRRGVDWLARYGGEEFVIVLPETDQAGALITAERIRQGIAASPVVCRDQEFSLTASFGVVTILPADSRKENASVDAVLRTADSCLYQAKTSGRNKVIAARLE